MKAKTLKIVLFSIAGVLLAILIALNVAASVFQEIIYDYFSANEVSNAARAAGEDLALQIQEEGSVLVKNEESALPLNAETDTQVNVFGWSATQWISSGSGSGQTLAPNTQGSTAPETDFLGALEEAGIAYNTDLIGMYRQFAGSRTSQFTSTLHSYDYESCRLIEPAFSSYDSALLAGAEAFSDIAIVVLGRGTGESNDAPLVQYKGLPLNKTPDDTSRSYLEISTEEEDLLKYVGETYETTIVLINSTNAMNLGFMDEIPGLDACLVVGGTGMNAVRGVVNLLYGEKMFRQKESTDESGNSVMIDDPLYGTPVSPSGKLTDTYVYDFRTNPAWANTGTQGVGYYSNGQGKYPYNGTTNGNWVPDNAAKPAFTQVSYLDYAENLYVGYKWYETADAEQFWTGDFAKNNFGVNGYDEVVQYPFGFGLTYTSFEWDLVNGPSVTSLSSSDADKAHEDMTVTVRVTNTGTVAAQEVVELYYTPPYASKSDGGSGIEKSAVNLLAFAKTPVPVEPGETQELTLKFKIADMASYDAYNLSELMPDGGWILEQGEYELSLRTDAHHVKEMSDATISIHLTDDFPHCDEESASNAFTGDNAVDNGISVDGSNTDANIDYLSRGDKFGAFPLVADGIDKTVSTKNRVMHRKLIDTNLYNTNDVQKWEEKKVQEGVTQAPVFGQGSGQYKLFASKNEDGSLNLNVAGSFATDDGIALGMNYDDPLWDTVLNSISESEMSALVRDGFNREKDVPSVNKALTSSYDGPAQVGSYNSNEHGTGFPMPTVIAQTWNEQLAKSFGYSVGQQTLSIGWSGWYAPGINLHRSAFGGRNYEYYSEDPVLSGIMGAMTAEGSLNAGVYVYVKHIIGYDQETLRDGLYCWMTEQSLREIYLKPFKLMIDKVEDDVSGVPGLMTAYGRIGATWSGGSEALLTTVLREEWGYHGSILTDYADHHEFMNGDQMVRAGGDLWMAGYMHNGTFDFDTSSAAFKTQLREATHHLLYTMLNAQSVASVYEPADDEITVNRTERAQFPLWGIIGAIDGVLGAACIALVVLAVLKKDKKAAAAEPAAEASDPSEPPEDNNQD